MLTTNGKCFTTIIRIIVVLFFLFLFPSTVSAQVVINEILPNPAGDDTGNEWVELYNAGSGAVDISGYTLKDASSHTQVLSSTPPLNAGAWLQILATGNFSLNNSGSETITLYSPADLVNAIDSFSYTGSTEGKSWGRIPDGGAISIDVLNPTAGSENEVPASPTPSPTETPAPTQTATPTPTPTKTATPTPKPSTPKPTASVTPLPTNPSTRAPGRESTSNEGLVLGLRDQLKTSEPTSPAAGKKDFSLPSAVLPAVLILGGAVCMGVPGYLFFKKAKSGYTNTSNENGENI